MENRKFRTTLEDLNLNGLKSEKAKKLIIGTFNETYAIAMRLSTPNKPQWSYLAIHIACLKHSIQFDPEIIRRKSAITLKIYHQSVVNILQNYEEGLNPLDECISNFYGCPSLMPLIHEFMQISLAKEKELGACSKSDLILSIAFQILKKSKVLNNLRDFALLWCRPIKSFDDIFKKLIPVLKKEIASMTPETIDNLTKEMNIHRSSRKAAEDNIIIDDDNVSTNKRRLSSSRSDILRKSTRNQENDTTVEPYHILYSFSCATPGPAFGPIFLL